ncbi:amidohydrolase family protein [Fodinibius sp.]|uniref:N-acyl-D-amino-acid deacylase family protein n=1 Tax=Fodinibius sp. TaxID=1872440 RepID=UPI003567C3EF
MVLCRTSLVVASLFIGLIVSRPALAQDMWDWHIYGGTIVDGTGQEPYQADILIRGNQIGYIGKVDPDTLRVQKRVEASGKIVSPGFIDPHAHGNPLETPEFRNFLAMGVTTILLGQDGSSPAVGSLDEWFEKVGEVRPALNIAVLTGHGSIRSKAGAGRKNPTEGELQEMEQLLRTDLKAGAFGMSTGLEYVPGLYAGQDELERLAEVVGAHDGVVMSHLRSEDDAEIEVSLDELAAQGKYAAVHVSHLKVVYGKGVERAEEILDYIEGFRKKGTRMSADMYPYSASYTGIGIVFPDWAKTRDEWKNALHKGPEVLRSYLTDKVARRNGPASILFGSGKYAGQTLKEAAGQEGLSPVDLLLEMGPQSASAAHFVMDRELQDRIAVGKGVMISSDGSPTMRHPRGYGSFAKVIRYYVNEKEILSLEEAIHKMSGLPARTAGLTGRGTIATGHKADLLIFDPEKVSDRATFENPHQEAEGFGWIMVNGQMAREGGTFMDKRWGRVLSRSAR